MTIWLQNVVHKIEVGAGANYVRIIAGAMVALFLIIGYNLRAYRNFSTAEAMDQAQLARNIANGEGYTTKYVRPFSMFLVQRANRERLDTLTDEQKADLCLVKDRHPDLANPTVYTLLLAGLMKAGLVPEQSDALTPRKFWSEGTMFMRYPSDFYISLWNQLLLLLVVGATFLLARRLFDVNVAALSALLLLVTELIWRFSVSGLSTLLLLLLFMGLAGMLLRFEKLAEDAAASGKKILTTALAVGVLLGIGMLTRYAYGLLIMPVAVYVVVFGGRWRIPSLALVLGAFALIVTPWIIRNIQLCGEPFGVAGYATVEGSAWFLGDRLQRSLDPNLNVINMTGLWWKFFGNLRQIVVTDLPTMGGGFSFAFFLVGLMIPFRSRSLSRMRYFLVAALVTFMCAQALGRTWLSDESPTINTENLLVLALPLVLVYGVGLFQILLDQLPVQVRELRILVIILFGVLLSLPMIFAFLPPRTNPVSFPPYHPPSIQTVSRWMGESELIMSDVPWAVAWYGDRQAIQQTLDTQDSFYSVNDYIKPVSALYLSPRALDAKFLTQWVRTGSEPTWGELVILSLSRDELPPRFPLRKSFRLPEQLFLTNWERWLKADGSEP